MKRIIVTLIVLLAAQLAFSASITQEAAQRRKDRKPDPQIKEDILRRTGGRVVKPGTQKGKVSFINTQGEMPTKVFVDLADAYAKATGFNVVGEEAKPGDPAKLKSDSGADVAVIIVADDTTPTMLAAVEDRWAVVNVRKLAAGFASEEAKNKFMPGRSQKEVLRAFAAVGGGLASRYPNNIMGISKLSDLDVCGVFLPGDVMNAVRKHLEASGVMPAVKSTYRQACIEGWGSSPTNEIQKAIWDKVHAIPSKPIKIEYNEKRDKGK